jgi:hypothetical protein
VNKIFYIVAAQFFLFALPVFAQGEAEDLGEGIFLTRNIRSETGPKIAIATVIISGKDQEKNENYKNINYKETVSLGTRSKELYAKRHGYDFIVATEKINSCYGYPDTRPLECAWTKLAVISRVLDDYDWVFWSDADSVIFNFDITLESFLDEDHDIIACTFQTIPYKVSFAHIPSLINTGEVFYKNSELSKFVIQEAWKNQGEETPGSFEQARINALLFSLPEQQKSKVLVYPNQAFNLPPQGYRKGSFLVHLFAYHGKELYIKFKELEAKYGWIIDAEEKRQNTKSPSEEAFAKASEVNQASREGQRITQSSVG